MTTSAQRASAIEAARAALVEASRGLDTARKLMNEHLRNPGDGAVHAEIDDVIGSVFTLRRTLGRLR